VKAAILYEAKSRVVVEDVDLQPPKEGEVLVRMAAAGVCHSDLHVLNGDLPAPLPVVMGHEGAGVVAEVGTGVTSVRPGDHVIMVWRPACGTCYFCQQGRPALCDFGTRMRWSGTLADGTSRLSVRGRELHHFGCVSTFAEYSVAPQQGVVPIRKDVPLDVAAVVGCAVMTGVGAVINSARVEPGASVLVIGCGGVGLNVIQGAALAGAERIIAVDVIPSKLALARQFGATHTLNAREVTSIPEAVRDLTEGRGADYAFEVIGNTRTQLTCLESVRRGGEAMLVGVAPLEAELAISPARLVLEEKRLTSTMYGSCRPHYDAPRLLNLYRAGKLKLDELISRRIGLAEVNEAFALLEQGEVARQVITFS
jgi:NDMA-dependent alcohol dehydrogenase